MDGVILKLSQKIEDRLVNRIFLAVMAVFCFQFLFYVVSFFLFLNSTLVDASWGDVSWVHQAFYNFTHGRPLQTSIYYYSGGGVAGNIYPYANQLAMHLNLTPYLFSFAYKMFPDLNALYATVMFFNIAGFLLFAYLLLKHYSPEQFRLKFAILTAFIFSPGFMGLIAYKCLFPLYQGVFILAMHYALLKERKWAFALSAVLLTLISEDAALFLFSYSAFLFLNSAGRFYTLFSGLLAAGYTGVVTFILAPAFKADMIIAKGVPSDILVRLGKIFSGRFSFNTTDIYYYLLFALTICAVGLLVFRAGKKGTVRTAALMFFVAPASHWFITLVDGGGHHPMPIFAMAIIAAAYLLGTAAPSDRLGVERYKVYAVLLLFSLVLFKSGVKMLPPLFLDTEGIPCRSRLLAKAHRLFPYYPALAGRHRALMASNRAVISGVNAIPKQNSVVYWTNRTVEGFILNRSDIWRFPSYYDRADYLVIQKDAGLSFFQAEPSPALSPEECTDNAMLNISDSPSELADILKCGEQFSSGTIAVISKEMVALIRSELLDIKRTHQLHSETDSLLVLKRRSPYEFQMPPSSMGYGWVRNIPKVFRRG